MEVQVGKISKALGFGDKDGWDCEERDGKLHCQKFSVSGNAKIANGTEFSVITDPQTCKSSFSGYSVLSEDEEEANKIAKKQERTCRGGLQ
jgi:hypothetical protein